MIERMGKRKFINISTGRDVIVSWYKVGIGDYRYNFDDTFTDHRGIRKNSQREFMAAMNPDELNEKVNKAIRVLLKKGFMEVPIYEARSG